MLSEEREGLDRASRSPSRWLSPQELRAEPNVMRQET